MVLNKYSVGFFLILLLIADSFTSLAQTDQDQPLRRWNSIRQTKYYKKDSNNVKLLNTLSRKYIYNHTDSALNFAKQALQLSTDQNYPNGQAVSLYNMASIFYVMGDYTASMETSERLMILSRRINYPPGIGESNQVSGLVYLAQDKLDNALTLFAKSLEVFTGLKDSLQMSKTYFDIGIYYDEKKQPDKAFNNLSKAIQIAENIGDKDIVAMAINRTGEIWYHQKKYHTALKYYQQVVNSKVPSIWEKGFAYSGMAQCYYELKQYDKAVTTAAKSYELSKKVNSAWDAVRALTVLSESFAALHHYKQAFTSQSILKKTNDSLFNADKEKELNYLHLKQQQADNISLVNDLKAKNKLIALNDRLVLLRRIGGIALVSFLLIFIRSNWQKSKLNKILKEQNDDIARQKDEISSQKEALDELNHAKDQLFSVISHDLRSPFTTVLQTIDLLRNGEISDEEKVIILDDFYNQVNLVTLMVNNLLVWANSQQFGIKVNLGAINITPVIGGIVSLSHYMAKHKGITLIHSKGDERWVNADIDHVKIIVQNLVGNAIKFTHTGGTIQIFYTDDEQYYGVHVKDNGTGISHGKMDNLFKVTGRGISGYGTNNEAGTGIGLILIKQFVDANDGKLDIQSIKGAGSEFTVYFRKANM